MKRGTLITIDGIDGVGKNTQATILRDAIIQKRGECGFFSFPRYDTPTGKLVGDYLKSGRTDLTLVQKAKLYADDRLAAKEEMESYLSRGVDVVCDRYVDSNLAYFSSFARIAADALKGDEDKAAQEMIDHIENHEYKEYGLPVADITFILLLPPWQATAMVKLKDERIYTQDQLDQHERDVDLLDRCVTFYWSLDWKHIRYQLINCTTDSNLADTTTGVKTKEAIAEQIQQTLESYYGQIQSEGC